MSKVTLINHSSILFTLGNKIKNTFLTDFWYQTPAFGSWLPSPPPFYHPTYLASLSYSKNLYLILSHAHDDHIDDYFLKNYFNKNMKIIISKIAYPSLKKRIKNMGFKNIISVGEKVKKIKDFEMISIVDKNLSLDDSCLLFRDKNYCVHHGNDNWFPLNKENVIKVRRFGANRKFLYAAQANSASGFPVTYPQFNKNNRELKNKVKKMLSSGIENCKNVKANYFLPYAGYTKSYVKNKDYENKAFEPFYKNLKSLYKNEPSKIKYILDLFCGGTIDLKNGKIDYPFNFDPGKILKITDKFYKKEGIINKCDTFRNDILESRQTSLKEIKKFLESFNNFVKNHLKKFPNYYPNIVGKKLKFTITNKNSENKSYSIIIGLKKNINNSKKANKEFIIPNNLFKSVLNKKIVFENLYTGYESNIIRYPKKKYNRDIITYLISFGYHYVNSKK